MNMMNNDICSELESCERKSQDLFETVKSQQALISFLEKSEKELEQDVSQLKQALIDRTKELEMVKRSANEMAALIERVKSTLTQDVLMFIGAGIRANYGKESVNDALAKHWIPVVALVEQDLPKNLKHDKGGD